MMPSLRMWLRCWDKRMQTLEQGLMRVSPSKQSNSHRSVSQLDSLLACLGRIHFQLRSTCQTRCMKTIWAVEIIWDLMPCHLQEALGEEENRPWWVRPKQWVNQLRSFMQPSNRLPTITQEYNLKAPTCSKLPYLTIREASHRMCPSLT